MTRNGCISFYQSSTYKLKLPSEANAYIFCLSDSDTSSVLRHHMYFMDSIVEKWPLCKEHKFSDH